MQEILKSLDLNLFMFLNGLHCSFMDPLMFWGTRTVVWTPLYLIMLLLVIREYKWQTLWIIFFVSLMILISDQLSNFFKDWIERPRPSHEPYLQGVHIVEGYKGGMFGFYSAHASNTMAVALYLILILVNKYRWLPFVLIPWAIFIGFSRIYLGVHYPSDILAGWLAGLLIGFCTALVCLRIIRGRIQKEIW